MENSKIIERIENIKNKKSKFLFFVPDVTEPSASIYEIFYHAHLMKNEGYDVKLLVNGESIEKPYWIEDSILDVEIQNASNIKLKVGAEDVVVIPEILTNVFEQTKNIPSIRIGLLQSFDYMLNGLLPGSNWGQFGIKNVFTTSETLKHYFENTMGNYYDVKVFDVGIPSYFENKIKNKKPTIPIVYRNKNDITKIVKLFYMKYPQYSWLSFDGMVYSETDDIKQLSRQDFAKKLDESFAAVWIDRISSFGTFPLECYKTKTFPIGLIPDIKPDYIDKETIKYGYWAENIYEIPDMIANVLGHYLEDSDFISKMNDNFESINKKYRQEDQKDDIVGLYVELLNDRLETLEKSLKSKENEEK
jgi:hypothetical protein